MFPRYLPIVPECLKKRPFRQRSPIVQVFLHTVSKKQGNFDVLFTHFPVALSSLPSIVTAAMSGVVEG